jgi:hypothetical protein
MRDMQLRAAAIAHIAEGDERHDGARGVAGMEVRGQDVRGNRLQPAEGHPHHEDAHHRPGDARHGHGIPQEDRAQGPVPPATSRTRGALCTAQTSLAWATGEGHRVRRKATRCVQPSSPLAAP